TLISSSSSEVFETMRDLHVLKQCKHGKMLLNPRDVVISRALYYLGEWCENEIDLLKQAIDPGQTVIEAGANLGPHTLFFANQVGTNGHVYAFEPQRLIFQALCASIALNNFQNVTCLPYAVGENLGTIYVPDVDYFH